MAKRKEPDVLSPPSVDAKAAEETPAAKEQISEEVELPEETQEESPEKVLEGDEGVDEDKAPEEDDGKVVDLAQAAQPTKLDAVDLWKFRALSAERAVLTNSITVYEGQITIRRLELDLVQAQLGNQIAASRDSLGTKNVEYNDLVAHIGKKYDISDVQKIAIDPVSGVIENLT